MHPADIDIAGGIATAWRFLGATWKWWLPVVVVVTVAQVVLSSLFANDVQSWYRVDQSTARIIWTVDLGTKIGPLIGTLLGLGLLGLAASWVFTALSVAGLRRRPPSVDWIVRRGLWTLWAGILIWIAAVCVMVVAIIVLAVLAAVSPALAVLAALAVFVVAIVVVIRLAFTALAIFDGRGPIEGIFESWHLSQQSVLRMVGWGLMAFLVAIGFAIVAAVVSAPFSRSNSAAVGQGLSILMTEIGGCYLLFLLAVLYESQRARRDLIRASQQAWAYRPGSYPPGYPPGSYPPGPYPTGPYAQGPYAQGPYGPGSYPPGGPYAAAPYPTGPYPAGPGYPAGQYPPGPYPPGPFSPGPYPPGPYAPPSAPPTEAPGPDEPPPSSETDPNQP